MSKKKDEVKVEAPAPDAQLEKLKQQAYDEVYKALGTSKKEMEAIAARKAIEEDLVEFDTGGIAVSINGVELPLKGTARRVDVEQILALASAKRSRLMNEMIGRDAVVQSQLSGQVSFKEIRRVDQAGVEVSKQ